MFTDPVIDSFSQEEKRKKTRPPTPGLVSMFYPSLVTTLALPESELSVPEVSVPIPWLCVPLLVSYPAGFLGRLPFRPAPC